MGSSREETRELLEQVEEAHKQMYASFGYERVPVPSRYKWEIYAENPFGDKIHMPDRLITIVKTEDAAQMLCFVYKHIFFGFTIGEIAIMLEDPAKEYLTRFMREIIAKGKS